MATQEVVGFKIKGIQHILDTAGDFGVCMEDGDVRLGIIFLYLAPQAKTEVEIKTYKELGTIAKGVTFRKERQATL